MTTGTVRQDREVLRDQIPVEIILQGLQHQDEALREYQHQGVILAEAAAQSTGLHRPLEAVAQGPVVAQGLVDLDLAQEDNINL